MHHVIVEWYRRHRFVALFFALLLTVAVHGAFGALGPGFSLLEALLAATLVAAIAAAAEDRAIRVLIALALAFVASRTIAGLLGIELLMSLSQAFWVIASFLATVATVRHALRAKVVDAERIFAALDAYLLIGLMFGVCYWVLDQVSPESFGSPAMSDLGLNDSIYFSFVTIATLGYGDIVPLGEVARGFAVLESVIGQMYLTVLVAWLVSLFARERDA